MSTPTTATSDSTPAADEAALRHRLDEVEAGLFLVVGCGRSGTSLLQAALSAGPEVVIPPETKFYAAFAARGWLHGDPSLPENRARIVDRIAEDQRRRGLTFDIERLRALAAAARPDWDGLFLALLTAYADARGAPRVGEKSPVHTHHMDHLVRAFPRARFIHVLRDPRAVVSSRVKAGFGTRQLVRHIERWRRAVQMHRRHANALGPDRYLVVRYEDLVRDFETVIRRVAVFLELDLREEMLRPHERKERGFTERSRAWMENTLKPVFTSSIERWRTDLPAEKIALVEHALAKEMCEMGYESTGARVSVPGVRLGWSRLLDLVAISAHRGRMGIRHLLRRSARPDLDADLEPDDGEDIDAAERPDSGR